MTMLYVRTYVTYGNMMSIIQNYITHEKCNVKTYVTHEYEMYPNLCYIRKCNMSERIWIRM